MEETQETQEDVTRTLIAKIREEHPNVNKGHVWLLIGALKSGLYEKGTGKLHRIITTVSEDGTEIVKNEWCCLGVGSDAAQKFGLELERDVRDYSGDGSSKSEYFGGNADYLSTTTMEFFGFRHYNPPLVFEGHREPAGELNDSGVADLSKNEDGSYVHPHGRRELTFDQIADAFYETYIKELDNA
jgi:hypothetical protein